jgi:hypothetical protein
MRCLHRADCGGLAQGYPSGVDHFDAHACTPPPSADQTERHSWQCPTCGRWWDLEWFRSADGMRLLGSSWILEERAQ